MAATPESKVKDRVRKMLTSFDVFWAMPFTSGYGTSGMPDFLCCVNGRFLAIECKAGNNRPTAIQEQYLQKIRDTGGTALVINENNLDTLAVHLAALQGANYGSQ